MRTRERGPHRCQWKFVYGFSHIRDFAGQEKTLRGFEKFTLKHNGFQALYAETLMSFAEFCTMFPRVVYDQVELDLG